ncbi:isoform a [Ceraceosorus bombacis]|uniref:Isoform a n=1 Tax=Ceraceosorus bombacis TaxID=401625 RepID=A0A0P1BJY7_9BASI|nr:isoform a [Ceraceosorus bombacis]
MSQVPGPPSAPAAAVELPKDKLWRKLKQEPIVPIGCLATCGALLWASYALRKGDRRNFQIALRWRVGLQGLTVLGAVAGMLLLKPGEAAQSTPESVKVASVPGRPPTNRQVEKASADQDTTRAEFAQRMAEAEEKERQRDLAEKEAVEKLLRPGPKEQRPRPVFGQDKRTF